MQFSTLREKRGKNVFTGIDTEGAFENTQHLSMIKILTDWGAWVAQLVKRLTLDFGSGHDLKIMRSSPVSGSMLRVEPA